MMPLWRDHFHDVGRIVYKLVYPGYSDQQRERHYIRQIILTYIIS